MKKFAEIAVLVFWMVLLGSGPAWAHFGGMIPSADIVSQGDKLEIALEVKFFHPMEGGLMNMEKPARLGVMHNGKKVDLLGTLKEKKLKGLSTWESSYKITRPGDYLFYLEPKPYWEPAEDCYIVHYTKVCVHALGLEKGWDEELGLETEIVPLTRPYGLWTGNVFSGVVKRKGNAAPYAEIEVEYYNADRSVTPPADPYVTQIIKADANGVFHYALPRAGWWAFAALSTADRKMKGPDGKEKPIELGAVFWVRARDMK